MKGIFNFNSQIRVLSIATQILSQHHAIRAKSIQRPIYTGKQSTEAQIQERYLGFKVLHNVFGWSNVWFW